MNYCNHTVTHVCFVNYSELQKEDYCRTMIHGFRRYYGYIPLPFSIVELLITVLFLLSVGFAMRKRRVSRKSYLLLANRSIGDLIMSIGNVVYNSFFILTDVTDNVKIERIRDIGFQSGYWVATISYVALCCLKLFAVLRPFTYIKAVTLSRIFYLVIASWLFAFAIIASTLLMVNVIPLMRKMECDDESCTGILQLDKVHNVMTIAIYFVIVVLFTYTAFVVQRKRKGGKFIAASRNCVKNTTTSTSQRGLDRSTTKANPQFRFSMWKLTLNVGSFIVFNSAYVLFGIYILSMPEDVDHDCEIQQNFVPVMVNKTILRIFQSFRIILDPIIGFFTDLAIRRSMITVLHLNRSLQFISGTAVSDISSTAKY